MYLFSHFRSHLDHYCFSQRESQSFMTSKHLAPLHFYYQTIKKWINSYCKKSDRSCPEFAVACQHTSPVTSLPVNHLIQKSFSEKTISLNLSFFTPVALYFRNNIMFSHCMFDVYSPHRARTSLWAERLWSSRSSSGSAAGLGFNKPDPLNSVTTDRAEPGLFFIDDSLDICNLYCISPE